MHVLKSKIDTIYRHKYAFIILQTVTNILIVSDSVKLPCT